MLVYDIPLSPYAQKVKLALLEKGIPFEARIPALDPPDAEFRALSPRLEVPVLVDGDVRLFDSSIIVQYIEERWPESPLLPERPAERARVRTLEEICDTLYDAVTWGIAEIKVFQRASGEQAERMLATAGKQTAGLNARLERELEHRPYFNGERFGFGDIAVYPFVNGAAAVGNKPQAGGRLEAWLKAARGRPSADRIREDVKTSLPQFMKRPAEIAAGRARREYRDHRLDWMLRSGGIEIVVEGMRANSLRFSQDLD
jgi:glutathione S-transferase